LINATKHDHKNLRNGENVLSGPNSLIDRCPA
jgi:hypothetical protein